jgi:hypothetical protein
LSFRVLGTPYKGLFIGDFVNHHHNIGGGVFALNETLLLVQGFTYDGTGPDAFFWAGTESERPSKDGKIMPFPFDGET